MPRLTSVVIALLVCLRLAAAEVVTPELPVSSALVPDADTSCSVISGASHAYAVCYTFGAASFRMDLDADGKPILATRGKLEYHGTWAAAGDALFDLTTTATSLSVRRIGGDAELRIDAAASAPWLTWDGGSRLLITWRSGGKLMGAIADTSLHVIVPPFAILAAGDSTFTASADGGFMVVVRDSAKVTTAAIVDPGGSVHPIPMPALSLPSFRASDWLTSNGRDYLHVLQRDHGPLLAQRYSSSGDPIGDAVTIGTSAHDSISVSGAVWNGSDYLIAWDDYATSFLRTLNGAPQSLGDSFAGLSAGPAGVFLTRAHSTPQTVRRLDTDGPEYVLSYGLVYQWYPAIATADAGTAVVWTEANLVRIGRIAADGTPLDGAGVILPIDLGSSVSPPNLATYVRPAIAFDGMRWLVVWMRGTRVTGVFFGSDGVVGKPFLIAEEKHAYPDQLPDVTWSGSQYLVTWSTYFGGAGAMVSASGDVAPFAFSMLVDETSVSAGPRTLVAYSDFFNMKIAGVFLDAAGYPFDVATDTSGVWGIWLRYRQPRVVTNGRDFLLTWVQETGPTNSRAWVARLDEHGRAIGEPFVVVASDVSRTAVSAIPLFDGTDYRIVVGGDPSMPLYTARVTDAAFACRCLDDRLPIPIDFDLATQGRGVIAAASDGHVIVGYERWLPNPLHGSEPRVFLRFIREPRRRAAR